MKLHILCFFNVMISTFTTPQFVDIEPEKAAIQLARSLVLSYEKEPEKVLSYEHLSLFYIGDFDDQTGAITPLDKPTLLLNCFDEVNKIKVHYAEKAKKVEDSNNETITEN